MRGRGASGWSAAWRWLPLWLWALAGCGARSELREYEAGPFVPECQRDDDCDDGRFCTGVEACREGRCVPGAPVVCDDHDECTDDSCTELTRSCVATPRTRDRDGDGHAGPRPGFRPGAPGACGDDCDDQAADVYPGAREVCNGRDDNCNGAIDDDATFEPAGVDVRVSEPSMAPAGPGGVAWAGERYLATYWGYDTGTAHVYFSALDRTGARVHPPDAQVQVTQTPSDAFGAGVAWTGRELGIVWQDRRDGDYEIYFNRLTPTGEKLGPDQRVSFARGFSINPQIAWTGREYVLVWQDERDSVGSGGYEIYAQRIDAEGRQIEDNQRLTVDPSNSEAPVVAVGADTIGVAWLDGRDGPMSRPTEARGIWFATFSTELRRVTSDLRLTRAGENVVAPALAWSRDRWLLAWHDAAAGSADHEVWGTALAQSGATLTAARRLTHDPGFSRYPSWVALGDRALLVWADDRGGDGYDIYARMLDPALDPLGPEARVTHVPRDSVYPVAAPGPAGDVGVLFRDQRDGRWQVHFTRLVCAIP